MITVWIVSVPLVAAFAIYSTIVLKNVDIWTVLVELVGIPLTGGGMVFFGKCMVQHWIAGKNGKNADLDFPDDEEELENE